ncbi:MAG: L,D-transpeptidase [Anaerolineae bacterium]|nr:L,D-transpeptidase [Anaerolineae bacterium]
MVRRSLVFSAVLILATFLWFWQAPAAQATLCKDPRTGLDCRLDQRKPTFTVPPMRADSIIEGVQYGWIEDYAYFYAEPEKGARHVRTATTGFFYGPAVETATDSEGNEWYKVWGHWLPARYYHKVDASEFSGIEVNRQPLRPFGWVLRPVAPSTTPGEEPGAGAAELPRYTFVQIYKSSVASGVIWHNIGSEGWVRHDYVAITHVRPRPNAVEANEFWVDVDLTEQTFAAYEGDNMVFAGLVSSGLARWPTRTGLNQVWERRLLSPMRGGTVGDDYYYIDDVAHSMYFDGEIALHGAFWHDDFGRPKSHGCVNMAPRTAEWVFDWSENAPNDLWVRVHYANAGEFLR